MPPEFMLAAQQQESVTEVENGKRKEGKKKSVNDVFKGINIDASDSSDSDPSLMAPVSLVVSSVAETNSTVTNSTVTVSGVSGASLKRELHSRLTRSRELSKLREGEKKVLESAKIIGQRVRTVLSTAGYVWDDHVQVCRLLIDCY
jgi:hypothetical protein